MIENTIKVLCLIAVLLVLEFFVERKILIRKRIVQKIGIIPTFICIVVLVVLIQLLVDAFAPQLNSKIYYELFRLGVILYFIPRRSDKKE